MKYLLSLMCPRCLAEWNAESDDTEPKKCPKCGLEPSTDPFDIRWNFVESTVVKRIIRLEEK